MTAQTANCELHLPASIKAEAKRLAAADGASLDQFVATAVAGKVAALRTADYFAARRGRANWDMFDRIMSRDNGALPGPGDELLDP